MEFVEPNIDYKLIVVHKLFVFLLKMIKNKIYNNNNNKEIE